MVVTSFILSSHRKRCRIVIIIWFVVAVLLQLISSLRGPSLVIRTEFFQPGLRLRLNSHPVIVNPNESNPLSTQTSYIDENEDDDTAGINSGLGTEQIIYVDDDVIVVNKPTFCQTAPGFLHNDSLATRIADTFQLSRIDKMICHRLDYATSGVVVFARNELALRELHKQFAKKLMYKQYSAIVKGYVPAFEGEVCLPLGKDRVRGPPLCCVDTTGNGKPSLTHWTLYAKGRGRSHIRLRPSTGRTHQLRIHMSAIGHPIVGDLFYAPKDVYRESSRLLLHAEDLCLIHPRTNTPVRFHAPCPFSLENIPTR